MDRPFEKLSEFTRKMQEPAQKLAELNVKALQGFTYLKPNDLTNLQKPEELVEKQIHLAVENGHKALDYMQKAFRILEESMLSFIQEVKEETKH